MPDGTSQDRAERAEVDLERFFSLSIDMLCTAGFDGYFKRVNPAWERTLGWTPEELTTRLWLDFVHPDDLDATIAEANKQTEQGLHVISFENRYLARDGSYRWLLWNSLPCPERGETHAVARDVSDRHEAEERLRVLNEMLEARVAARTAALDEHARELARSNADLETFTYSVSHDLKEPLRTLEAFSRFVIEDYGDQLDDRGKEYLNKLANASARMKRLIDDLLALSRIGRSVESPPPVDVRPIVADVIDGMRATVEQHRAQVVVSGELPMVQAEPMRVAQIFGNLISNGIKFNHRPQPRISIGIREQSRGEAVFFVADNGIGIEPEYHDRIFGVFQRLHRREDYEGTGAGLAIVKRAVEGLGGRIWVESAPGAGTTFLFTLPTAAPSEHVERSAA